MHVLNEHHFPTPNEAFLVKIIHVFVKILSNGATLDFFYSNDLKVGCRVLTHGGPPWRRPPDLVRVDVVWI